MLQVKKKARMALLYKTKVGFRAKNIVITRNRTGHFIIIKDQLVKGT